MYAKTNIEMAAFHMECLLRCPSSRVYSVAVATAAVATALCYREASYCSSVLRMCVAVILYLTAHKSRFFIAAAAPAR